MVGAELPHREDLFLLSHLLLLQVLSPPPTCVDWLQEPVRCEATTADRREGRLSGEGRFQCGRREGHLHGRRGQDLYHHGQWDGGAGDGVAERLIPRQFDVHVCTLILVSMDEEHVTKQCL